MLKRIQIKNFRSCKDVTIEGMGNIIALIGRNAAGKTNILKAMEWVARAATNGDEEAFLRGIGIAEESPSVCLELFLHRKRYRYSIQVEVQRSTGDRGSVDVELKESVAIQEQEGEWRTICDREGTKVKVAQNPGSIEIGALMPCLPALVRLLPPSIAAIQSLRKLHGFLARVHYYPLDELNDGAAFSDETGLINDVGYEKWLARYRENQTPCDEVSMRVLHMFLSKDERLEELKALLGKNGLGLIDDVVVEKYSRSEKEKPSLRSPSRSYYFVRFLPIPIPSVGADRLANFSYRELSLGTRRIVRILVSLLFDRSKVMLIEHPEDGIHTGLVKKVASLLRTNLGGSQLILSTHSPTVLNTLDSSEVRLVTMEKGETRVRALNTKELKAAARFVTEEGMALSDFLEGLQGE